MSDPVCWCASDVKCPHALAGKLPLMWYELEHVIDDVLHQFDRRAVKKFLKRDIDGNSKGHYKVNNELNDMYHTDPNSLLLNSTPTDSKKLKLNDNNNNNNNEVLNPLNMRPRPELSDNNNNNNNNKRPHTSNVDIESQDINMYNNNNNFDSVSDFNFNNNNNNNNFSPLVSKMKNISKVSKSMEQLTKNNNNNNNNNNKIKKNNHNNNNNNNNTLDLSKTLPNRPQSANLLNNNNNNNNNNNIELPESTVITMGLLRIADILSRKVLPWQAAFCPRAVENLRETRNILVAQKHESFVIRMTKQLEDKVVEFLDKKNEEVDTWIQLEIDKWHKAMSDEETTQTEFYQEDEKRLCRRSRDQENAQRSRESNLAGTLDDQEREATREQLINFRRLCRTETRADVRALHASIEIAKTKATAQTSVTQRDLLRRQEEAHDWLCCVSDNAVTAQESEYVLKRLYDNLDLERNRALTSLQNALTTYKQQFDMIYEAITVFHGKVHQHANDYLRREQLVSRAFLQYLISILNGEIKTHTSDVRKKNVAWEAKFTIDRSNKKETQMNTDFTMCMAPFDQKVEELRTRMKVQKDQVIIKMQSILNGRDNDVNKRKSIIHKKLARYVKKVCNDRRLHLKDGSAARLEEYALEEKCVNKVAEVISELRTDIDQIWVKEHIRERRMYEAVSGRMERLEKSSILIWNKHAHLAVNEKEDYQDWLLAFEKSRMTAITENRLKNLQDYKIWRKLFANIARGILLDMKRPMKRYIESAQDYNAKESFDSNMLELTKRFNNITNQMGDIINKLSYALDGFITTELNKSNEYYRMGRENLILDWQINLHRLNNSINRRVSSLKGMEKDLEETIRLTLAQNEIEACVFEQASCARVESFWTNWRDKIGTLGKQLKESLEDFRIAKSTDRVKVRTSIKDRLLDDLILHPDHTNDDINNNNNNNNKLAPLTATRKHGSSRPTLENENNNNNNNNNNKLPNIISTSQSNVVDDISLSDTSRLKAILDEIRSEVFVEFVRKNTRGFEMIRKNHGEGRKRTVPLFMLVKIIISAADSFWERAKMSERCIGRITARGMRIFMTGLPRHARSMFCIAVALIIIVSVPLRDNTRIDPDEVVSFLEQGTKKIFLAALLSITIQYGSFGDYLLNQECIWACTSCHVIPPIDPNQYDIDYNSHIINSDPADIINSLLSLPEFPSEEAMMKSMLATSSINNNGDTLGEQLGIGEDIMDTTEDIMSGLLNNTINNNNNNNNFNGIYLTHAVNTNPLNSLIKTITITEFMNYLNNVMPSADIAALLGLLGRHNNLIEVTYQRFFQAVYIWRKISISMLTAILDPPGSEYIRLQDLINIHVVTKAGKKKVGLCDVSCISPFEGITNTLDWITSISGAPLSMLQALAMITRSGNVDPWIEDLKQSSRSIRFTYELTELLDSYICKDYYHSSNIPFQASFQNNILDIIKSYDVNGSGNIPIELLRTYIQKDDTDLTNSQITCVYWCICRCAGEADIYLQNNIIQQQKLSTIDIDTKLYHESLDNNNNNNNLDIIDYDNNKPLPDKYSLDYASNISQNPMIIKRTIRPEFFGDINIYLEKFKNELSSVIETMPQLDTNVVVGLLDSPLNPVDAHQIVADAMKLDVSAKNNIPSTTSVWLGLRRLPLEKALATVSLPTKIADINQQIESENNNVNPGDRWIGVGLLIENNNILLSKHNALQNEIFISCRILEIRLKLEMEILTKFPIICDRRASDMSYGAGGTPIMNEDHFQELTKRRLDRIDKLTIAWRQTMMNEWATSLYQSRKHRYSQRADIVKKCIQVYQNQYSLLKNSIVNERKVVMTNYTRLLNETNDFEEYDHKILAFHTDFLSYTVNLFHNKLLELITIVNNCLREFQNHVGTIKRKALLRVKLASDNMRTDLELSCKGLIEGYTGGYAQKHFDELLYRGERWRINFTVFHGTIIAAKEKFSISKKSMDDEVMQQIQDRIAIDRNRTKKLLERLNNESLFFHESLNTIKTNSSELMKDANQRIMLRIERAVRECKKLRSAGEKDAQLEKHILAEIRIVLSEARGQCNGIVENIRDTTKKQLDSVEPRRIVHRERMDDRINEGKKGWIELEELLQPLTDNYEKNVKQTMGVLKSKCMDSANQYKDEEISLLHDEYIQERKQLISSFREHFTDYDLSEAQIFERFNIEVNGAVNDIRTTWGSNNPLWLRKTVKDANDVSDSFIKNISDVIRKGITLNPKLCDDDTILTRIEIGDTLCNTLKSIEELTNVLPEQFADEKRLQITQIKNNGMKNNNDMIRPQIVAVTDLLLSGIQINHDFESGYDALKIASIKKSQQINEEVSTFIDKYLDPIQSVSITYTAKECNDRIKQRREEVETMIAAANSHVIADHSKLEVEIKQGYSDIEQWNELTLQLIRGAFDASVEKYLEPIWPTPEGTPRDETLPDEIDRVEKIKSLLMANYEANVTEENSMIIRDEDLGKLKDPATTRELQEGWLECCTNDMVIYYYNQQTGESLWDLPAMLKIPKYPDPDPSGAGFLETPRELVVGEFVANQTIPRDIIVSTAKFTKRFRGDVDVTMLISDIMGLVNIVTSHCIDTAIEITDMLKNPDRKRPRTPDELPDILNADEDNGITDYLAQLVGQEEFDLLKQSREKATKEIILANENLSPSEQLINVQKLSTKDILTQIPIKPTDEMLIGEEWLQYSLELTEEEQEAEIKANEEAALKSQLLSKKKQITQSQKPLMSTHNVNDLLDSVKSITTDIVSQPLISNVLNVTTSNLNKLSLKVNNVLENVNTTINEKVDTFLVEKFPVGVIVSTEETEQTRFAIKQQIYRMTREIDAMQHEDAEAQVLRDIIQNQLKESFEYTLRDVLYNERIFPEQITMLHNMTYYMHRAIIDSVMKEYSTSWLNLNDRVAATQIIVKREQDEAEATRQATIIEFRDDIEEMYDFFRKVGLSKTVSKKAATECIAHLITTSKKLAKVWSKQGITMFDLTLDEEDGEEVEAALKLIILENNGNGNNFQDISWYNNNVVMQQQQENAQLQQSLISTGANNSVHSIKSIGQSLLLDNNNNTNYTSPIKGSSPNQLNSLYNSPNEITNYDPNYTIEPYNNNNYNNNELILKSSSPNNNNNNNNITMNSTKGLSKYDNYKSFVDGWIECTDDKGNIYYYNTISGESSWILPELKNTNNTNNVQQIAYDNNNNNYNNYNNYNNSTTTNNNNYVENNSQIQLYNQYDYDYESGIGESLVVQDPRELQFPIPRMLLPVPITAEVDIYSKEEGIIRQMSLLTAQDKWQVQLNKLQGIFLEQRNLFLKSKEDLFNKITLRVETRLGVFVDDIKYMQRALKQELAELESSERDLRRLFDDENAQILMAEKLSFIMEGMDKLKQTASTRYEGSIKQMDKFLHDWVLIETELNQVGDIYDETVESNLEQCYLQCEHVIKVFTYEQLKASSTTKKLEMNLFRNSLSKLFMSDTYEIEYHRNLPRMQLEERYRNKERKLMHDRWEYQQYELQRCLDEGFSDELEEIKARFAYEATLPIFVPFFKGDGIPDEEGGWDIEEDYIMPEEELVMSFLLTQIEMEKALSDDYDSIVTATKTMSKELNEDIKKFDAKEKLDTTENGSWYNKHRDTIKRHAGALHTTLERIRNKVMEGYRLLNSKLEALDFDVEQAAESELADMRSPTSNKLLSPMNEETDEIIE